ncbi:uncharacterized protein LOC129794694 [Lutzomyia longipalpis]|uniref:uncharacterized protein LOC129794694 n=1 Tax=Lutzomyia longipalpis TaxID=7200 RepID=UPI002483A54C|nr:uncharacterized protein LOC129794694 [Lutzomyia longipalpis]
MSKKKMRRRSRMKTLKILHPITQGQIVAFILLYLCSCFLAEPGYLDFDNLPETNFTCAGKVIGGYYADLETSCQMFHVCTIGQLDEPMDIKFLCLNGTVFDQETRVCERVDEVDCSKSERFYYLNLELYGNTMVPVPEESADAAVTTSSSSTTTSTTSTTTSAPPVTTTTTTTTQSPVTSTTRRPLSTSKPSHAPYKPAYTYNNTKGPAPSGFSTTPGAQVHYLSSTAAPTLPAATADEGEEAEDDYEYDDDYFVTDRGPTGFDPGPTNPPSGPSQVNAFSPQHFIFQQKEEKAKGGGQGKPAISFQQQQFENGGSLHNSHITVTTHTATPEKSHKQPVAQQQFQQKGATAYGKNRAVTYTPPPSITTSRPQYNLYGLNTAPSSAQLPKRIPLLPTAQHSQNNPPTGHAGYQQHPATPFRLRAQGFQLPVAQPRPFEGYRRHMPQIPLHLPPFEQRRDHKEILGFEDAADALIAPAERKELKRSDPRGGSSSSSQNATVSVTTSSTSKQRKVPPTASVRQKGPSGPETASSSSISSNLKKTHSQAYDRVLLTPQDRYISSLPKVVISASASVSDGSGKKLNYSIGSNVKIPPPSYDDYREGDVILDPFFLDVPKIKPRIKRFAGFAKRRKRTQQTEQLNST